MQWRPLRQRRSATVRTCICVKAQANGLPAEENMQIFDGTVDSLPTFEYGGFEVV